MEEDTWNKIIDIRVNGSLSHFLSYFSVMEPSSPFFYKSKSKQLCKFLIFVFSLYESLIMRVLGRNFLMLINTTHS